MPKIFAEVSQEDFEKILGKFISLHKSKGGDKELTSEQFGGQLMVKGYEVLYENTE